MVVFVAPQAAFEEDRRPPGAGLLIRWIEPHDPAVAELVEIEAVVEIRCGVCHAKGRLKAVLAEARGHITVSGGWEPAHPATATSILTTTQQQTPPFVFVPGDGVLNRLGCEPG